MHSVNILDTIVNLGNIFLISKSSGLLEWCVLVKGGQNEWTIKIKLIFY